MGRKFSQRRNDRTPIPLNRIQVPLTRSLDRIPVPLNRIPIPLSQSSNLSGSQLHSEPGESTSP